MVAEAMAVAQAVTAAVVAMVVAMAVAMVVVVTVAAKVVLQRADGRFLRFEVQRAQYRFPWPNHANARHAARAEPLPAAASATAVTPATASDRQPGARQFSHLAAPSFLVGGSR